MSSATNLGLENFWNPMKEKYPNAVKSFCDWVDEYKKEVGWKELFGARVKFYDVPLEMQRGILARYIVEKLGGKQELERAVAFMESQLRMFEENIIMNQKKNN